MANQLAFNFPPASFGRVLPVSSPIVALGTGTGKSTALVALAHTLHHNGFEGVFCAPSASAADSFRRDGLEDAVTLRRLCSDFHTRTRLVEGDGHWLSK